MVKTNYPKEPVFTLSVKTEPPLCEGPNPAKRPIMTPLETLHFTRIHHHRQPLTDKG